MTKESYNEIKSAILSDYSNGVITAAKAHRLLGHLVSIAKD